MKMKKFTADSYYEALLLAQQEFGEDVEIITSRTFDSPIWGGLGSHEMVEVTAAAPSQRDEETLRRAPKRPVETEELAIVPPRPSVSQQQAPGKAVPAASGPSAGRNGVGAAAQDTGFPESSAAVPSPTTLDPGVYSPFGRRELRNVHGIRTMQEGIHEPRPQRLSSEQLEEQKVKSLLQALAEHKTRDRAMECGAESSQQPQTASSRYPAEPFQDSSVRCLEEKLNMLQTMLQQVLASSNRIPVPSETLPKGLSEIQQRFRQAETPEEVVEDIIGFISRTIPQRQNCTPILARQQALAWLQQEIHFSPKPTFDVHHGPKVFVFLGPTGVGKTTTIAKLAASFALDVAYRKSVALFTLDTFRIGAANQLAQYAQIIGTEMEIIYSSDDVPPALQRHQDKDIIFVDTAGRCPKNKEDLAELKSFIHLFPEAETFLTLSATTRYSDLLENIDCFGDVGFDHLIFTKVDETSSVGPLLGLLARTPYPLAYITHGQNVPDDFQAAHPDFFASHLFPAA